MRNKSISKILSDYSKLELIGAEVHFMNGTSREYTIGQDQSGIYLESYNGRCYDIDTLDNFRNKVRDITFVIKHKVTSGPFMGDVSMEDCKK